MLMKIFSCFRLQIPSRKLSSGRHYLPSLSLFLSLSLVWITSFKFMDNVKIISNQQCLVIGQQMFSEL